MIRRGEVWWAELPEPTGSEPGFHRPILVVSADSFNQSAIATLLGVVLTSNQRLAEAPGNILLPQRQTGLPRDSVANVSQVMTVNKNDLTDRAGRLSDLWMVRVENGLRLSMAL